VCVCVCVCVFGDAATGCTHISHLGFIYVFLVWELVGGREGNGEKG
jgi:hypothetical protein